MKQLKSLTVFFILLISSSNFINTSSFTEKKSKQDLDLNVPAGAKTFYQGWTKYFHTGKQVAKPSEFFLNKEFSRQRYPSSIAKSADSNGPFVIPDDSSFFVVVYKDQVSIYTSRDEIVKNSYDTLLLENILPVPEDDYLKGGVANLGFYKAGYCMKVKTKTPAAFGSDAFSSITWVFCFKTLNQKSSFTKALAKVKILDQRSKDQIVTAQAVSDDDLEAKKKGKLEEPKGESESTSSKDGKMVLLQDWSECTLKCGGGKSYQQWMCVPPKNGGKPCKGDTIRVKDCNEKPCPEARTAADEVDKDKEDRKNWKKPTVKIARFSKRFNRYTKCSLMETDIFRMDSENNKLPSRIIMNPSTLTIFGNDDYLNKVYSFDLKNTEMKVLPEFCCFELKDQSRNNKFCGFDTACGDPEKNAFVVDLAEKFNEFKTVCNKGKSSTFITNDDEKNIKKSKQKALQMQNFEVENDKAEAANEQMHEETDNKVFKKLKDTQIKGLKALEREVMIENLIKRDEQKKEDETEQSIMTQLQAEREKNKIIDNQIKEKELEEEFKMEEFQAAGDIKEAQKEISQQIEVNREKLRKQIEEIRKEAKKRRETLHTKVKKLKSKITNKLMKASKVGDKARCTAGLQDEAKRDTYCNTSHPDDYLENEYCKNVDNFCYSCCDSEFGLLRGAQRDDCYDNCDRERDRIEKELEEKNKKPAKPNMWQWKATAKPQ